MKKFYFVIFSLFSTNAFSQSTGPLTIKTLFLGNSYTYVNNLPQIIADMALSTGDTFIYDGNTPGGYTLMQHSTDNTSLNKIIQGSWDYVVLQEQSQLPSFPPGQVATQVYPYAQKLDSIINAGNPCTETMFYMTWGRKNGDASNCAFYPPVCTYEGMDSLLRLRYTIMAGSNQAVLSPVGAVWRYIRQNHPLIELYQSDESHPSPEGSYAAACCFYSALFRKDPTLITFDFTLNAADAALIRNAAKVIVFDSLPSWNVGLYDPIANFNYVAQPGNQVSFNNLSSNATSYTWYFGDGDSSHAANPVHTYQLGNMYQVTLIAGKCNQSDTLLMSILSGINGPGNPKNSCESITITTNPSTDAMILHSDLFLWDTYRIRITNLEGKLVYNRFTKTQSRQSIDFASLSRGSYIVSVIKNGTVVCTRKIIK